MGCPYGQVCLGKPIGATVCFDEVWFVFHNTITIAPMIIKAAPMATFNVIVSFRNIRDKSMAMTILVLSIVAT
jgi:hypothetical protein